MNRIRLVLLSLTLPSMWLACTPPPPACNATTCATGCCSANGVCELGSSSSACGRSGAMCSACTFGTVCSAGSCMPTSTGVGGGSVAGGSAAGGSAAGGSAAGGSAAGGSAAGGSAAGGSAAGGSAAGGSAAGGSAAGGSAAGGSAAGGSAAGGSAAGGSAAGGSAGGGSAAGGSAAGGSAAGGSAAGGSAAGGSAAGGSAAGGSAAGGSAAGGSAAGGSAAGGSAAGGSAAGGSAAGGSAAGGSAAGGSAAGGSAAGGSAAGGSAAGGSAGSDVTGTFTALNYLANGTTVTTAVNLTTTTIEAYVPSGVSYTVIPGTGQVNGTFTIPGVPAGNALIRVGVSFLETSARQVIFNSYVLGRPSPATATVNPTTTTVSVTGLQPWQAGQNQIVWVSPNVGNTFYNFPLNPTPLANATTATLGGNFNGVKLVNQAQGDDTWLLQYRFTTDGGSSSGAAIGATQLAPFTQLNGQTTALTATMQLPPNVPSLTQALSWNLNAFSVLQTSLPPGLNPKGFLAFSPFPSTTPNSTGVVDFWFVQVPAADLPPTSLTLVTPFPSGWSIVGRTFFSVDAPRQVAGTTGPLNLASGFGHYDTLAALTASPITPRIGPITNLTLNGTPFIADRTSVGSTVALGWTAPTLGAATTYYVTLYRLSTASGAPTTAAETLEFSTGNTSLVIPSSLLIAGQPYAAQVQATNAGYNPRVEYGTRAVPQSVSTIATPIFRP